MTTKSTAVGDLIIAGLDHAPRAVTLGTMTTARAVATGPEHLQGVRATQARMMTEPGRRSGNETDDAGTTTLAASSLARGGVVSENLRR